MRTPYSARRIVLFLFAIAFGLNISSNALALVMGQIHYGIKSNTLKETAPASGESSSLSGSSIGLGVDFDPVKTLPVGAGFFYHMDSSKGTKDGITATYTESVGGLEIMAWAPLPAF